MEWIVYTYAVSSWEPGGGVGRELAQLGRLRSGLPLAEFLSGLVRKDVDSMLGRC